jgi:hypothetical protein
MIRRLVIALMLIGVASSANAATIPLKGYKSPKNADEKAFMQMYLDGVREGIVELNVVMRAEGRQPLFCLPGKLALTVEQAEDIMMRQAQKMTDSDTSPIGLLLIEGLMDTFPCDEKH